MGIPYYNQWEIMRTWTIWA